MRQIKITKEKVIKYLKEEIKEHVKANPSYVGILDMKRILKYIEERFVQL